MIQATTSFGRRLTSMPLKGPSILITMQDISSFGRALGSRYRDLISGPTKSLETIGRRGRILRTTRFMSHLMCDLLALIALVDSSSFPLLVSEPRDLRYRCLEERDLRRPPLRQCPLGLHCSGVRRVAQSQRSSLERPGLRPFDDYGRRRLDGGESSACPVDPGDEVHDVDGVAIEAGGHSY